MIGMKSNPFSGLSLSAFIPEFFCLRISGGRGHCILPPRKENNFAIDGLFERYIENPIIISIDIQPQYDLASFEIFFPIYIMDNFK